MRSGVRIAVAFGRLTGANYTLLRGLPIPYRIGSPYLPHSVRINVEKLEKTKQETTAYLDGVGARLRQQGFATATNFFLGALPAAGILEFVERHAIELIAITTHGRRGATRLVLGSVADKVVRGSDVPLLVYHPERA